MASIVIGIISIALGVWGFSVWWWSVAEFFRGVLPVFLVAGGIIALSAGIRMSREEIKDAEEDEGEEST